MIYALVSFQKVCSKQRHKSHHIDNAIVIYNNNATTTTNTTTTTTTTTTNNNNLYNTIFNLSYSKVFYSENKIKSCFKLI